MTTVYIYQDFKQHLKTNPKWIARGLCVLKNGIPGTNLLDGDIPKIKVMVNQLAYATDGRLPWTLDSAEGRRAVLMVLRYAPAIYNYYVQLLVVSETTS